jgi:hypothetical protein
MQCDNNFERPAVFHGIAMWDQLPDIPLYMDQVISYMSRQLDDDDHLTPSMIHNYTKEHLLPRSEGKKYSKEHIASLTAVCLLKQILTVRDAKYLMRNNIAGKSISDFYDDMKDLLDEDIKKAEAEIPDSPDKSQLAEAALQLAVSAYAEQLICRKILENLRSKDPDERLHDHDHDHDHDRHTSESVSVDKNSSES